MMMNMSFAQWLSLSLGPFNIHQQPVILGSKCRRTVTVLKKISNP